MRADQLARLEVVLDSLINVAISDADPTHWVGAGKRPGEMTQQGRGDARWCRSLALGSISLTMQVQRLMECQLGDLSGQVLPVVDAQAAAEETEEAEIKRYEHAAAKVLARAQARTGHDQR